MSQTIEYYKSKIELHDKSEDNHALGMLYVKNERYIDGLAYTKRAIENDPYQKVYWRDYVSILEKLNLSLEAAYILGIYTKFIEKDVRLNAKLESLKDNSVPNQNIVPANEIGQIVNLLEKLNPTEFLKECNLFIKRYPLVSIGYLLGAFAKIKMKRYQDARNLCLVANAIEPENSEVLLKLGDVYRELKSYEKGYKYYKRGLEIQGDNHHLLNNLSVLLNQWDKPEEALNYSTALLKLKPNDRNALFNKAISLSKLQKTKEALESYDKIIQTYPSFQNAFINKASLCSDLKDYSTAISTLNQLLHLDPSNQIALQNLASNYNKNREIDLSIKTYRKLLNINSSNIPALINLGIILKNNGEIDDAITLFENALRINNKLPHAYNNLSGCYLLKENFKKAEEMVNQALKIDENFTDALINLGLIKSKLQKFDEASQAYQKAKDLNPNNAILRNNLGNLLIICGNIDLGIIELKEAIKINKTYAQAHRHLTFAKKYQKGDPHKDQIKKLISNKNLSTDERSQLHFALAKIYGDIGQYEKAFGEIITANKLAKLQTSYNFEKEFSYWTLIKKMYEAQIQEKKEVLHNKNYHKTPIFIVGMPRTGSSILAELISRYPGTKNLGETGIFEELMFKHKVQDRLIPLDEINAIRAEFYQILNTFGSHIAYVDKQLFNVYWIGHIKYLLPEAKILLMVRDKSPTCWSIFKNYFSAQRYGFSYSPEIINQLFNMQKDVNKFWSEKNIAIKKVNYRELVETPNKTLRNIYEYLDFEWSDTFLSSQNTIGSIINTNSAVQARKPIYVNANKDWVRYKKFSSTIENLFS